MDWLVLCPFSDEWMNEWMNEWNGSGLATTRLYCSAAD